MTIRVALTGSIGMGKSTTAQMFRDLGVPVWDADASVAKLYESNEEAIAAIGELVPDAVTSAGVSRAALREAIAADPNLLKRIEAVIHPLVTKDRETFFEQMSRQDEPVALFDIPLLFETNAAETYDVVIVVTAPPEVQKVRVLSRGTMSEEDFELILSRQTPDAEKQRRADFVIETLSMDAARQQVAAILNSIQSGHHA